MRTWLLHWSTALLVALMLLASLPIPYPDFVRMPPSLWMGIHMSAGWILVAITAVRFLLLAMPHRGGGVRILRPRGLHAILKAVLLVSLTAVLATGVVIFRPSPLGPRILLFGHIEADALFNLAHAMHLQLTISHRYLGYALALFLIIHIYFAFESPTRTAPVPIAWLWKRGGPNS